MDFSSGRGQSTSEEKLLEKTNKLIKWLRKTWISNAYSNHKEKKNNGNNLLHPIVWQFLISPLQHWKHCSSLPHAGWGVGYHSLLYQVWKKEKKFKQNIKVEILILNTVICPTSKGYYRLLKVIIICMSINQLALTKILLSD